MKSVNNLKILGFAGSLRVSCYNKALLRATIDLLPEDVNLEIFEINGIPYSIKILIVKVSECEKLQSETQ